MFKIIIVLCAAAGFVFGMFQPSDASDLCCVGKTEKNIKGDCIVKNFQDGRICLEETSKECWGRSGCYALKDLGNAGVGSHVVVTGWRAGDQKCYNGPNCGKVIVVGGATSKQSGAASSLPPPPGVGQRQQGSVSLPPPPGSQPPAQDSVSLPPPPLPEGGQAQQQPPTASLPAPPQQPQPQTQPPAQQEPQQPVTQTIDSTLDIFKKVKDLFR